MDDQKLWTTCFYVFFTRLIVLLFVCYSFITNLMIKKQKNEYGYSNPIGRYLIIQVKNYQRLI